MIRSAPILVLLAMSTTVTAEEARGELARGTADPTRARQSSSDGAARYRSGDFGGAAAAFGRAYELGGPAPLLFNLAQAHRRAGDCVRAHRYYVRFLDEVPVHKNRTLADRHRRTLARCAEPAPAPPAPSPTALVAEPRTARAADPPLAVDLATRRPVTGLDPTGEQPPRTVDTETRTSPLRTAGWVTAGIGLGGVIAGLALSCDDDCEDQAVPGRPLLLGGAAVLTVGVGLAIWGHTRTRTVVVPRASGAVVARTWSF